MEERNQSLIMYRFSVVHCSVVTHTQMSRERGDSVEGPGAQGPVPRAQGPVPRAPVDNELLMRMYYICLLLYIRSVGSQSTCLDLRRLV